MKLIAPLVECIDTLEKAGFEAYVVGGAVRDWLVGRTPTDFDIATSAMPSDVVKLFAYTSTNGIRYGTVTILISGTQIEVTTYRVDGEYVDSRHPNGVVFTSSLAADLMRRDFTINALAYNPTRGLVDNFGGIIDLERQIISVIGDGVERFTSDALRILRAFRFSATYGFSIDSSTMAAIGQCASLLLNISAERITSEICKIICSDNAFATLKTMEELGVSQQIFHKLNITPQVDLCPHNVAVRLAVMLSEDKTMLRLDISTAKLLQILLDYKNYRILADIVEIKQLLRKIGTETFTLLVGMKQAMGENLSDVVAILEQILRQNHCYKIPQLNINGDDIISLGYSGKLVGTILNSLLDMVIKENDLNRHDLLIVAVKQMTLQ